MKGFIFIFSHLTALFLLLFFVSPSSAQTCETYQNQRFCVGNKVIANEADGVIVGVSKTKISIDFTAGTTSKKGIETFNIDSVVLGVGCIDEICVNEKGVGGNTEGEIVGVSPLRVSLKHKFKISTYPKSDVLVRKGCLDAYCANDSAVFKSSDGIIVGINKIKKLIAISFVGGTSKYTGVGTYGMSSVAIGKGCILGFCIGDRVVSASVQGSVIGVNPYRGQLAILGRVKDRPVIVMSDAKDVTLRSFSEAISREDKKRLVKSAKEFNQTFIKN